MNLSHTARFYWRAFWIIPVLLILFTSLEIIVRVIFFGSSALWHLTEYNNRSLVFTPLVEQIENPDICWKLGAHQASYFRNTRFNTNQYGFRDREFAVEKTPGIQRIAVLGRSTTMGSGVKNADIYSRQLQLLLDERYPQQFEVLNFAVGAYRFTQMQAAYEAFVARFKPDVIMWPIYYDELSTPAVGCPNLNSIQPRWDELRGYFTPLFLYGAGKAWIKEQMPWLMVSRWRSRGQAHSPPSDTKAHLLERFIQARTQEGIKMMVPVLFNINHIERQKSPLPAKYIQTWIQPFTKNPEVQWVNTVPDLIPLVTRQDLTYLGDNHPNTRVHRLYAESIARQIHWEAL